MELQTQLFWIPSRPVVPVLIFRSHTSSFAGKQAKLSRLTADFSHMANYSASLRVLIVEEDPLLRWSLVETLADSGHVTIEADGGEAAIRALSQSVDVILLGGRLLDSTELTLLSTLKHLAPDSAIVVMTAHSTAETTMEALRLGAYQVLAKPFEMHNLEALIERANRCRPI